jgi:hypothetical protein
MYNSEGHAVVLRMDCKMRMEEEDHTGPSGII